MTKKDKKMTKKAQKMTKKLKKLNEKQEKCKCKIWRWKGIFHTTKCENCEDWYKENVNKNEIK